MLPSNSPPSSLNIYAAIEANKRRTRVLMAALVLLAGVLVETFGLALGLPWAGMVETLEQEPRWQR